MIHFNFYELLSKFSYIPAHMQIYFSDLEPEISFDNIDRIWDRIIERFTLLFPYYKTEQICTMKNEIFLSIYTSVRYTTTKEIDNSKIASAFINFDTASKNCLNTPESIRSGLSDAKKQLKEMTAVQMSGQYFSPIALKYFSSYWNDDILKVFSDLDFYSYLKEYKHWPYYIDNQYGMTFTELFDSYQRILDALSSEEKKKLLEDAISSEEKKKLPEDAMSSEEKKKLGEFEMNFSAYIFEELLHPISMSNFICNYFEYFSDLFYEPDNSASLATRERVISLLSYFSNFPLSIQANQASEYCSALKKCISKKDSLEKKLRYFQKLDSALLNSYYIYPLLQIICCKALFSISNNDLEIMENSLRKYLTKAEFNYQQTVSEHLENIKELFYPKKPDKEGMVIDSNIPVWKWDKEKDLQKGRNNKTIQTFEINSTYYFFYKQNISNVIDFPAIYNQAWNPDFYLEKIKNDILTSIPNYFSGADSTWNYSHYLRVKNKDNFLF